MKQFVSRVVILLLLIFIGAVAFYYLKQFNPRRECEYRQLLTFFNPSHPGWGVCDYGDHTTEDIPKAYAMFLSAELNRSQSDDIGPDLTIGRNAGQWLLDHADEDGDGIIGWGLPVAWDAFGDESPNPANSEYTISTAIVINSLLDWIDKEPSAPRARIISVVNQAIEPYLREKALSPGGIFTYSLEPCDQLYDCFNPAACLAGQMQRFSHFVTNEESRGEIRDAADRVVLILLEHRRADPNGGWYWPYSLQEPGTPNDLCHACYIIDGLKNYILFGGTHSDKINWDAVYSHLRSFASPDYGKWNLLPRFSQIELTNYPPRLYGLGMALYIIATNDPSSDRAESLVKWAERYRLHDGRYTRWPVTGKGNNISRIVVQEYQAYYLYGLSHYLFKTGIGSFQKNQLKEDKKIAESSASACEKPLYITPQHRKQILQILRSTSLGEETEIPFLHLDTASFRISAHFNTSTLKTTLHLNEDIHLPLEKEGIPLNVLQVSDRRLLIFFREIFSNNLLLIDSDLRTGKADYQNLNSGEITFYDFREAVYIPGKVASVFYDNSTMKNYLIIYDVCDSGIRIINKITLPSLGDPAGKTYENTPAIYMVPVENGVYILGGRLLAVYSEDELKVLPGIPECLCIVETASFDRGVVCIYKIDDPGANNPFRIYNITTRSGYPYDQARGIPWNLRKENKSFKFDYLSDVADLGELFRFDFCRGRASGALYLGTNNIEGRSAWSQLYYLNGLIDIIALAQRSDRMYEVFHDQIVEIKKRLDLEIYLLDLQISSGDSIKTRAFTVDRSLALFAVQSSRFLILFDRYIKEVDNHIEIKNYERLKKMVCNLDSHIEVLKDQGESERWIKKGRLYLRWPKGCSFSYDGTSVPYNHQNEWATSIFKTIAEEDKNKLHTRAARDMIMHFLNHILVDGAFPKDGKWPYWWGVAYDGWEEDDNVSEHKKSYPGDKSGAWISFRSIDAMAVLTAGQVFPELVTGTVLDSIVRLVNQGLLYPFVCEELLPYKRYPALNECVCNQYVRITSPWEIQNSAWVYLRYPLKSTKGDIR